MTIEASYAPPRPRLSIALLAGGTVATAITLAALVSLFWTPLAGVGFTPLAEPDAVHLLGTDPSGRDVLSLLMPSTFGTLILAVFGTLLSLFVAVPVGVLLAIRNGDTRDAPAGLVIPAGIIVGLVVSGLGAVGNLTAILSIALPGIVFVAIGTRHALAPLWRRNYVAAARIAGLTRVAAAQRHVLPQLLPQLGAMAVDLLALAILIELSLSFAGLGALTPGTSLGLMLLEAQQFSLARPMLVIAPGAVALALVLALRLVAFGLRGGANGAR